MTTYTRTRVFDWEQQSLFARISGDCNPIHVDRIAARRVHGGTPIVHGIHSLCWILDTFAEADLRSIPVRTLKAQFSRPIQVGDEVTLEIAHAAPKTIRARIVADGDELVSALLSSDHGSRETLFPSDGMRPRSPNPSRPELRTLDDMEGLSGCLSFCPLSSELANQFPHAVRVFGLQRMASLVASSCLVGMVVPGLHSIYCGLDLSLSDHPRDLPDALQFAVVSVVKRFRSVRIAVSGGGLRGTLDTVSRMPPVQQPGMQDVIAFVSEQEFRGSTALIVGGSRGLGELTAKLIAAGGGEVAITYTLGAADAEAVKNEIESRGAHCEVLPYDILRSAEEQLARLKRLPTHVYYFATPTIFRRKSGLFDPRRFAEFSAFYLSGFFQLVSACASLRPSGLRAFYPSTTYVETRPTGMTEYAMCKAAGEVLCADISKEMPGVQVLTRRLPRLPTDQTSSIVQTKTAAPIETLLPIVREMHAIAM